MKTLIALLLIFSVNASAVDICSFEETWNFKEALKAQDIQPVRVAKNHKKFTSIEKQLIHRTVKLQGWLKDVTLKESLEAFGDYYEGRIGENAGEIIYYNIDGKQIILVHYWPGENEYGAFYQLNKNGSYKLIAEITDSFIECK